MGEDQEHSQPPQSVLKDISTALKEKGVFEKDLSPQEVEQMMTEIVRGMIADSDKVEASVESLSVTIRQAKAALQAGVDLKRPVKARIRMSFGLENGDEQGKLKTSPNPQIDPPKGSVGARIVLKSFNLEGKTRAHLSNPNQLIFKGLGDYLRRDGVGLQGMTLSLGQETLAVRLQGIGQSIPTEITK